MIARLRRLPWHPVLFAASIVIAFWLDAMVSPHAAIRSLIIAVVVVALVTLIAGLLFRSAALGGLLASGIIGLLYGKRLIELVGTLRGAMEPWMFIVWIALVGLALLVAVRVILRSVRRWTVDGAGSKLNQAALILFIASIGSGLVTGKLHYAAGDLAQGVPLEDAEASALNATSSAGLPDVYLILLDGYPRADVLAHAFDLDNSGFESALAGREFVIAPESHAEYLWTHITLSSMLSMEYVEEIGALRAVIDGEAPLHPTLRDVLNDNPVFDLAREKGYQVVALNSGYEQLTVRRADVWVDGGQMNEFELKLLVSTFLGDVLAVVTPDLASGQHRDRIEYELDAVGRIAAADADGPRLVFAHIPAPHQPTVFGRAGEPVVEPIGARFYADSPQERREPLDEFAAKYRDQLHYLNGRIIQSVDEIIANSVNPPVVILWADHGSASRVDWVVTESKDAAPDVLLERTGTLFAALTPGRTDAFPDDIAPVNIFRYLADAYYGTDYGPAIPPPGGGQIPAVDASVLDN